MKIQTAESWSHLQELLFEGSWNEHIGRFRSPCVFRGLSDAAYQLKTSLLRLGGDFPRLERHLLRNFKKYAHRDVVEKDSYWHWLSVAQHHGLPTRLLDWTYSPFVAMHFATANTERFDRDGAIWVVDYETAHELVPDPLRQALRQEGANAFTAEILAREVDSLEEFDRLSEQTYLVVFEPPSIDDRIVNQHALFSLMSDAGALMDDWYEKHPDLGRKIIVPAGLKWEIRDKLDQGNITERVLFPGLDGLSSWQKRHYSPKRP